MKQTIILLAISVLSVTYAFSQSCIQGAIVLENQSDVNNFSTNYPNCVSVIGNIIIRGTVTDLQGLSQIISIDGLLMIEETTDLTDLSGLENITVVDDLTIQNNAALVNLSGLDGLTMIIDDAQIRENPVLTSLTGLGNLTLVSGDFKIYANNALSNLVGLESLARVEGFDFEINTNAALTSLQGLDGLTTCKWNLAINNNDLLASLEGLGNLKTIGGDLRLVGNDTLVNMTGLNSLDSIIYQLRFDGNSSLVNMVGLSSLTYIGDDFEVIGNASLVNFEGLDNLAEIVDYCWIQNNPALQNLSGMNALHTIDYLLLDNNDALVNMSGFENITALGGTRIKNNDLLIDLSGLENITTLNSICQISTNSAQVSLHGLHNLTSVNGDLKLDNLHIEDIQELNQLQHVGGRLIIETCDALQNLTGLENLTYAEEIEIRYNDALSSLTGLQKLSATGGLFSLRENPMLTEWGSLDSLSIIGGSFSLWSNGFFNFEGLEHLEEITGDFELISNHSLVNLAGLNGMRTIGGDFKLLGADSIQSLDGLENLEHIGALGDYISIANNANLADISAIANADISNLANINLLSNPQLSWCDQPNICDFLVNVGTHNISLNATGCNTAEQIINECSNNLPKVQFEVFYDLNENEMRDSLEPILPNSSVLLAPSNNLYFSTFDNGGLVFLDSGSYTLTLNPDIFSEWQLTTDSASFFVAIGNQITCETIAFGLYPLAQTSDVTSFITGPPARCGTVRTFEAHASNLGTTLAHGTLWLEVDPQIDSISFVDIPDTVIGTYQFGWHFEQLSPGNVFSPQINLGIPAPPDVEIGDSIYLNTFATYSDINGSATTSTFDYPSEVRCSFDPNDKQVSPARNSNYTLFDEALIYTIRFQNTGNDEAYNIVIKDTLDVNLEPATFRVLATSHPEQLTTEMEGNRYVSFNFPSIYLPDSTTNFEASQGYVTYLIHPKQGLAEETNITNTASIYFDFNPAIVTNTTENLMVSALPTSTHYLKGEHGMEIQLFPNPVSDFLTLIKTKKTVLNYEISDLNGRLILQGNLQDQTTTLDFSTMNAGIYFIKIIDPKTQESIVDKIVK